MIVYAPDIVGVGRMFLVALNVPRDAPDVQVDVPACAALFDRTRLPAGSELRKFYFRALSPAAEARIGFRVPGGAAVEVPLVVWSFEDLRAFRTLKGVQLPRRWPLGEALPGLKKGQALSEVHRRGGGRKGGHGHAKRAEAGAALDAASGVVPGAEWLDVDDETIWNMQPDSTIPRWHWVNVSEGCPEHGTDIYREVPYYPWLFEGGHRLREYRADLPYRWKIRCPFGEEYPSNEFARGDMTSGDFPDDGMGGGFGKDGVRYGFIAETAQAYCHQMLRVAPECADGFLRTADPRFVRKALIAMSRLAVEYAYLAVMTQHRHRNTVAQVERLGQGRFDEGPCLERSGFTVYCIDSPGYQIRYAELYDALWPAIEKHAKDVVPFLQGKGIAVETGEDVRRFLEENLFAVWMQGAMDGATHSNEPFHQWGLARMAEVLDYGRGDEFIEWLYDGGGGMRTFVTNGYFRDGAPYESMGGYNGMHVMGLGPVVESVEHLRSRRPRLYPAERFPSLLGRRYHAVFDFSMNTVNIGRTFPRVGDEGSHPRMRILPRRTWQNGGAHAFEHAYLMFRDPKFAWALACDPEWQPPAGYPFTRAQVEEAARAWPDDWNDASLLQDGYGLAMLRSGAGDARRALWMTYGRPRGHVHDDIMHIGLDALEGEILGHMGYPRNWSRWEHSWMTQILGRQVPFADMTGRCELFCDAGPAHVAEAFAQGFSFDGAAGRVTVDASNTQRRMLALIDVSAGSFYCVDLYRILGGTEHWRSFHCQEGTFTTRGLDLVSQGKGTLAGPGVPYGDPKWLEEHGCSRDLYGWKGPMYPFPHLYNVRRVRPAGPWSCDWDLKGGTGAHFRLTVARAESGDAGNGLHKAPETVLCDGTSPAGGNPYEMPWVLMHSTGGAAHASQAASVMEVYRGEPVASSVRAVAVDGTDEHGLPAYGLEVKTAAGTDTLLASADAAVERQAACGARSAGRFALIRESTRAVESMVLIGGTLLAKGGFSLRMKDAEFRSTIVAVDREKEEILLAGSPRDPAAMIGRFVSLRNADRQIAYRVQEARLEGPGARLRLEFDSLIGIGRVIGWEPGRVLSDTRFPLQGFRYYHGARIVAETGGEELFLEEIRDREGAWIDTDRHSGLDAAALERRFPRGSWFRVYDYGVGDELVWTLQACLTRAADGRYSLVSTGAAEASLPEGFRIAK